MSNSKIKEILGDTWQDTAKSKKENGGWMFYDVKTNTIQIFRASEGDESSMPQEPDEYKARMRVYDKENREVVFLTMFHTHPKGSHWPSGGLTGQRHDVGNIRAKGDNAIGIVIYGPGKFTFYDRRGQIWPGDSKLDKCL